MTTTEAQRILRGSTRPGWLKRVMVPDWDRWHEAKEMIEDERKRALASGDHDARGFTG